MNIRKLRIESDLGIAPFDITDDLKQALDFKSIDIKNTPCDIALSESFDPLLCAKFGVVPWQKLGNSVVFLASSETSKANAEDFFLDIGVNPLFAYAPPTFIESELRRVGAKEFLQNAHEICPERNSVRSIALDHARYYAFLLIFTVVSCLVFQPLLTITLILLVATVFVIGNSVLRMFAMMHYKLNPEYQEPSHILNLMAPSTGWPHISILVPLYKESEVLYTLIQNLLSLDYPKSKLDIKLLIEIDDLLTKDTLEAIKLPPFFDIVFIPVDTLRTKPKAMNFALPFCKGDIIGVFDAEDKPDILQLRKIAHKFARAPKNVACVQCELDFFNARQNWFTRCFTIEYRIWFAAVLPAIQRFGIPVPLGGTSLYLKRDALIKVGAWDAYNVTEDADLGVRLKRNGYETLVLHSKTMEEANSRGISWIKQRSRWLKGYMMTWLCHMRDPMQLWKELGPVGFLGFQITFMGAIINYLSMPAFWTMLPATFDYDIIGFDKLPYVIKTGFFSALLFSQTINISLAFLALRKNDNTRDLFIWYLTMPFYWPLGALAAYKASIEMVTKPFYWDKTSHGHAKNRIRAPLTSDLQSPSHEVEF